MLLRDAARLLTAMRAPPIAALMLRRHADSRYHAMPPWLRAAPPPSRGKSRTVISGHK